jgi:cytochrome c5
MKKTASMAIAFALIAVAGTASAREGKEIYDTKCFACHAAGVAGAPKFGDKEMWAPRIEKGMDALMETVHNGLNAMPPKGTCMDCTEEELSAAVQYMVDAAK